MAERILTWHLPRTGCSDLPAFYADDDYEKVAVRIHADGAPTGGDFELDIFDDGVSIFSNHATTYVDTADSDSYSDPANTKVAMHKGDTAEPDAENFTSDLIDEGSWITCVVYATGGAKNVTVHLELNKFDGQDDAAD
jgi:hypothetical protein